MRVSRDFEEVYRSQDDPWSIGDAGSDRYNRYVEMLSPYARGAILDIGCGFGALLARFGDSASSLDGLELSAIAVDKGRKRFPDIRFHQGSATAIGQIPDLEKRQFDLIICSDIINYFPDSEKLKLLRWINDHLRDGGRALIAAWSPGGKYLTIDEHIDFTNAELVIDQVQTFDSGHVAVIAERRRTLVSLTIDYETWQPVPPGKVIDWQATVFAPADRLLSLFEGTPVRLTFFVEMGEYFWLEENRPDEAATMKAQLAKAVSLGHDVQLHLHPSWLPELGARETDGGWHWDWSLAKAEDYPGDLVALIRRCKEALETLLSPVRPGYRVTCFRAGAYQAQPFGRLSEALVANGIIADSSVYAGGVNAERGYDYSHAYSDSQPYFADLHDPQLRAVPAEEKLVELPIFTPQPDRRWLLDGEEAERLAERLIRFERAARRRHSVRWIRLAAKARGLGNVAYQLLRRQRRWINRLLPRPLLYKLRTPHSQRRHHGCFVAIGHTKSELRYEALAANVRRLRDEVGAEFVTLSEMAEVAWSNLSSGQRTREQELDHQVERETPCVLNEERNWEQSYRLQRMIPLDVDRLLDFGCGAGYWSARIAELHPWMSVTGIDGGEAFIAKAREHFGSERVDFVCGDFAALPMAEASFDCVYADNTIEHSFDVDGAFNEIFRVLRPGGSLVAALPLDGLNPRVDCDNHSWKTTLDQALLRIRRAGFVNLFHEEVDTLKELGMAPYAPALDRMLYVRAWKPGVDDTPVGRAMRAMDWLHRRVLPEDGATSLDAWRIISDGRALCLGYTIAFGEMLRREGYSVTWITAIARDHPRGGGENKEDAHAVVEVIIEGKAYIFDPTSNICYPHAFEGLLREPSLADQHASIDARGAERGYHLYNTSFWYERVTRYARRRKPLRSALRWRRNPFLSPPGG